MKNTQIAIFASGSGTNAINLYHYFKNKSGVKVTKLICNKPDAAVLEKFKNTEVEIILINKEEYANREIMLGKLRDCQLIVLAGFLWLIPPYLIDAYPNKIINLHPSLLPKYGGKGMYGMNVHKAVIEAKEKESGITIHLVNKEYDKGNILFQTKCSITENDTPETLAEKIHELEQEHLPVVIEKFCLAS